MSPNCSVPFCVTLPFYDIYAFKNNVIVKREWFILSLNGVNGTSFDNRLERIDTSASGVYFLYWMDRETCRWISKCHSSKKKYIFKLSFIQLCTMKDKRFLRSYCFMMSTAWTKIFNRNECRLLIKKHGKYLCHNSSKLSYIKVGR